MDDAVLETARLWPRVPRESDARMQFTALNTPAVMAPLGGPRTLAEIAAKHARTRALYARHGYAFLIAIEKASGELIGYCGLKQVDHPQARNPGEMEIGWLIRADRWRQGYAAEAVTAVLAWAFDTFAPDRVVAICGAANAPSRRVMAKFGFDHLPQLDFVDPECPPHDNPIMVHALTRQAWRARVAGKGGIA